MATWYCTGHVALSPGLFPRPGVSSEAPGNRLLSCPETVPKLPMGRGSLSSAGPAQNQVRYIFDNFCCNLSIPNGEQASWVPHAALWRTEAILGLYQLGQSMEHCGVVSSKPCSAKASVPGGLSCYR